MEDTWSILECVFVNQREKKMADSSSEEEIDERFRAALDPSLSVIYDNGEVMKSDLDSLRQLRAGDKEADPPEEEETRESFILSNKIKNSLSQVTNINGHMNGKKLNEERPSLGTAGHRRRNNNILSGIDALSPISTYIAKQLTGLLDRNVEIASKPENISDYPAWKDETRKQSISLLKNFSLDRSTEQETGVPEKKRKVKHKKFCYFDSSDEDEVASKCHCMAVSPQSILDRCDDNPWPHPKNIRYLEKYKVKDRRANGSVLAVACNETCESTVRTSSECLSQEINGNLDCKMKGRHELKSDFDHKKNIIETKSHIQSLAHGSKDNHDGKKKMNKNDSGSKKVRIHCEEISYKAETNCKKETDITVKKVRKQSRKRGKKRKKKSENSNIQTNQEDGTWHSVQM